MKVPKLSELNLYEKREYNIRNNYPEFYNYLINSYPKDIKFAEKLWWYFHNISTYPTCIICNKRLKFKDGHNGYGKFCSLKCAGQCEETKKNRKQTNLEKYGNENYNNINKIKQTNLEKYGVENISQVNSIQEKRKQTNLEKWGITCTLHNKDIQEKVLHTNLNKYGVKYPVQNDIILNKIKQTNLKKYGAENISHVKNIQEKIIQTNLNKYGVKYPVSVKTQESINKSKETFKKHFIDSHNNIINYDEKGNWFVKCPHPECDKCKEKYFIIDSGHYNDRIRCHAEICTKLLPYDNYRSKNTSLEIFIKNILDKYNIKYETNIRNIIPPKEIDIYIPDKKIAIECNGLYWHSNKDKQYHINKFKVCEEKGIQLLTIWEDQIINKPNIIESIILSKLGIYKERIMARKCEIKEISSRICNLFLNNNHIQGKTNSTVKIGLYYNNELISIMTFSKRNRCSGSIHNNMGYWDLSRFCNKLNTQVIGGASKLLKYFIKHYNPINIISFASNDISNGKLYEILKFSKDNNITSAYWYINKKSLKRYHRTSFTKNRLKSLGYDIEGKTENDIMNDLPFYKIYDSGHIKFELNLL